MLSKDGVYQLFLLYIIEEVLIDDIIRLLSILLADLNLYYSNSTKCGEVSVAELENNVIANVVQCKAVNCNSIFHISKKIFYTCEKF